MKIILGMSGGVDSSVAAWLLQQSGYEVEGLFMKNWEQDDTESFCPAAADLKDAQAVCDQLQIPLHVVNFAQTYWDSVFSDFLDAYQQGYTPNPDVLCNKEIKFKAFFDHALALGADYIATGHYAKTHSDLGYAALFKSRDLEKDQTYFLHAIAPQVLEKVRFPLGDTPKTAVRDLAKRLGFINAEKKDSTGICFIGEKRFKPFLQEFLLAQPGPIINPQHQTIGEHDGIMFYTIGQRQGLHIGGRRDATEEPWYVVEKDVATNTLMVAQGSNHPLLYAQGLICRSIHWLTPTTPEFPCAINAKTRYRQPDQACIISPAQADGSHIVMFSTPQRAITPGQYLVFYQGTQCLGGAIIEKMIR
ncbi:MAG: tRNA 2-thiouridine(34) synthase MnmA [Legionellaceae bacterium]|nr:tRNA 2-thiouridine(34) synthase MnmA [Legionellaceae bacterium]